MNPIKPKSRETNLAVQELENEILIFDMLTNKAICLNSTSAMIWQACDGNRNISEISKYLSSKVNKPVSEEIVWLTLELLKNSNLIVNKEEIVFGGLSRREIIRKIGLSSAIALPLISTVIAPTASHAASNGICAAPGGVSCTTDADCFNSGTGDTCANNCCVFGIGIPGNVCIPSPTNICPPTPPGCDEIFGC